MSVRILYLIPMDRGGMARHMLYYAPGCSHCKDFIQRVKTSRVVHDFDAFDVTISKPPPQVTHVPTIFVMGEFLKGQDAFAWLERVSGTGSKTETPGVIPGQSSTDEIHPVEQGGLSFSSIPASVAPVPDADPRNTRNEKDLEDFEDRLKRMEEERTQELQMFRGDTSNPVAV